ncbi:MAG: DNA alkylation repair protein [Phycisphaerae bacterium]|nr:DNA alkylation repair protein [Phycisphaerae bacterium]
MPRAIDPARFLRSALSPLSDTRRAAGMAAYMKTADPFFGVSEPMRRPVFRELCERFVPTTPAEYRRVVLQLWAMPQRECRYAAIHYAVEFRAFHTPAFLPFFRRLIIAGAWWDSVDWISTKLIAPIHLNHRSIAAPVMHRWIEDSNLWVRRAAILSHFNHKDKTDWETLTRFCLACAHEKEFFIRKAIGWALRQHARTAPGDVREFLLSNLATLSPLSIREAGKHIGVVPPPRRGTQP